MLKAKYYHYRDRLNRPVITQCLLLREEGEVVAVGNSICSPDENPCKKFGRMQAYNRAYGALEGYGLEQPKVFVGFNALYVVSTVDWDRYKKPHYTVFLHGYIV